MSGPPRRRPYPYDAVIAGTGIMLGKSDQGVRTPLILRKKPNMAEVAPTEYLYASQSPQSGRVLLYDDLALGFGLDIQRSIKDKQYKYTINADLSVGGVWLKGPSITSYTPGTKDATNGISHFFEVGSTLFALNGRYILKRVSDSSWTAPVDFGATKAAVDVATFYTNAGGGANLAYIAMGDSELLYKFDGTTATQHGTLYARAFAVVGREFYRANATNSLGKCDTDADPWTAGNWGASNAFNVGDKNSGITRLAISATGVLLIFKTDGIYTIDAYGEDHQLYPHLKWVAAADNGKGFAAWLNDIYVSFAEGCFRIDPDYVLTQIGPEKFTMNTSEVKGRITAMAGHDTFNLYAGLYNVDSGHSYLLKFGGWVGGDQGPAQRIDTWHGSISSKFTSKKITALFKSSIGAASGHYRLYIGFSDGTVAWFTLPCTPNPAACTSYAFSTTDGEIYLPTFTGEFAADQKGLKSVYITGKNLNATDYAQFQYRTDPTASFTALGVDFNTVFRKRGDFATGEATTVADFLVILKSGATTSAPQLVSMGVDYIVRPELSFTYELRPLLADGLVARDGRPLRIGADAIRTLLRSAAGSTSSVATIFPDEETKNIFIVDYNEGLAWDERSRQWLAAAIILGTETVPGAGVAGTYEDLEALTYAGLETHSYGELESL